MSVLKSCGFIVTSLLSLPVFANPVSFDRIGAGFSTQVLNAGQWAWEQSLMDAHYFEQYENQNKQKITKLHADTLIRAGLGRTMEVQVGWSGPHWMRVEELGVSETTHGQGDISIALKKSIDLEDEKLSMAVLAKAHLATGDDAFSSQKAIYSLSSALSYLFQDDITTSMSMRYAIQDGKLSATAIPSLQYRLDPKWTGFTEGIYRKTESEPLYYAVTSGVMYRVNERVQLDGSIGVDFSDDYPSYRTAFGFAVAF